jgi:preprotein translocase subunit SecA
MNVKIESSEQIGEAAQVLEERAENISNVTYTAPDEQGQEQTQVEFKSTLMAPVGRNEACPCGSGKKYKFCHGKLA